MAKYYELREQIEQMHPALNASSDVAKDAPLMRRNAPLVHTNTLTKTLTKKDTDTLHKKCIWFDEQMGGAWLNFAKAQSPAGRFNKNKFAEAIMRMRTKFSMTEDQIAYMLTWIKSDQFWAKIAISPASLLKPSKSNPDITKLEQVIISIKSRKKSKSERVMDSILRTETEVGYNPLELK